MRKDFPCWHYDSWRYPKLVGMVGVAMVLFLRIDLCTYICRIDNMVLFVDEIKMGVYPDTIKALWKRSACWYIQYLRSTDPGYTHSHRVSE